MIAILVPTRGRPEGFKRMCDSAFSTANEKLITIFSGSNGGDDYVWMKYPIDIPTVYIWNNLAKAALNNPENKLFMLGSDDMMFATPGWDKVLIDHYNALENKIHVYHLRDSRDPLGTPHPIVTREYIDGMGYFLPPIFLHWFADTWTIAIATYNDCYTHLKEYELIHDKPSDKGQADETHNRIRRNGWHQRDQAVNDTCQHVLELEKKRLAAML